MANTPGTEAVAQTVILTIVPIEADGVTVTPGAVVSAQTYTVSDPTIATQVLNADGTASYTGVAAGTATISVTATVTDSDGTVGNFTGTTTLTVTGAATGRTAGLQLNFGTPA